MDVVNPEPRKSFCRICQNMGTFFWFWSQLKAVIPIMLWKMEQKTRRQLVTFSTVPLSPSPLQEVNISQDCRQRYHNHSILNYDPHPSGEILPFPFALTSLFAPVDQQKVFIFLHSAAENGWLLPRLILQDRRRLIIPGWPGYIDV